jgi:hypothetical protein
VATTKGLLFLQEGRPVSEAMKREANEKAHVAIIKAKPEPHPPRL